MSVIRLNVDDLCPTGMNNVLDVLDFLSDSELTILERCANIVLTDRDVKRSPKIVNDFVMSQLEQMSLEEITKHFGG